MSTEKIGWLASYPKSGNTWLRMMLHSLVTGSDSVDINRTHRADVSVGVSSYTELDELFGIESSELTPEEIAAVRPALHGALVASNDQPLLLRKVHDRFWHTSSGLAVFPRSLTRGAIYLVRDPRDVAVSFAHHRGDTLDFVIDFMANPNAMLSESKLGLKPHLPQPIGTWSDHVLSWVGQDEVPLLLLRYEDLLADPAACLNKAVNHLGLSFSQDAISAAATATRFEALQEQERANGFIERQANATAPFFRKGRAGDWRNHLTAAQAARIKADHAGMMEKLGYR